MNNNSVKIYNSNLSILCEKKGHLFAQGVGYYLASPQTNSMIALLSDRIFNFTHIYCHVKETQSLKRACDYVLKQKCSSCIEIRHDLYNINEEILDQLDHLLSSIELFFDPVYYDYVIKGNNISYLNTNKYILRKQPFQQLMSLDSAFTLIKRYNMLQYKDIVMSFIFRKLLGIKWITLAYVQQVTNLLDNIIIGYNIRRRMGKTVAVYAEIARCICFFPMASLKTMYVVHTAPIATFCFHTVLNACKYLLKRFNEFQINKYKFFLSKNNYRTNKTGTLYKAHLEYNITSQQIIVNFDIKQGGNLTLVGTTKNVLVCKAYAKSDVSISSTLLGNIIFMAWQGLKNGCLNNVSPVSRLILQYILCSISSKSLSSLDTFSCM